MSMSAYVECFVHTVSPLAALLVSDGHLSERDALKWLCTYACVQADLDSTDQPTIRLD